MLNYKAAARLPEQLEFTRNGQRLLANRVLAGEIEVAKHRLQIADIMYEDSPLPVPMRIPNGRQAVHVYQWAHPCGPINVCVVLPFRPQRLAIAEKLTIFNELRPDLIEGIIVDSAAVRLASGSSQLTLPSGLGDGYYPVIGVSNLGLFAQALILDFRLDQVPRYILLPGQTLDEFGIVQNAEPDS